MTVIVGVLLAAGRSRRMGESKQLLPWHGGTIVSAAFDAIVPFCDRMVVVLGHQAPLVSQALSPRRFDVVSTYPDAEMMVSIRAGLATAAKTPQAVGVLLHPAD